MSAIHQAKTRNSNTNTYRITFKHQESEFNSDTSLTLGAWGGYMEQSHNGSWPRPVLHLVPIYPLPSHVFSLWRWKHFLCAFTCTERFTKSRIFYTLGGTQIPCTYPFLLLSIWDSKGARNGLLLPKTPEGRVLRCPTQKCFFPELPPYLTLPAPVPAPLTWCWVGSKRHFRSLPKEEKKAILNDQINSSSVVQEVCLRNLITSDAILRNPRFSG